MTISNSDPRAVNSRLYEQIARLLDELEDADVNQKLDIKERIAAIIAIGRIQTIFVGLRKENRDGPTRSSGSAVRKYSKAFTANAGRGRKTTAGRRAAAAELADDDEPSDDDDG